MRIDTISIFPEFFEVLQLSLAGKAQDNGLLDMAAHNLRDYTDDRHRTVDDAPYGGGAGMVMKPEPWGKALDTVIGLESVLIVPTPSGKAFTQSDAQRLATEPHLVFACGRYEGIDQRVMEHYTTRFQVEERSIGDFVVGGGEIAAIAMIEAILRLLPGFLGNPDSLTEESHGSGPLLEYPVYTRPAEWRGLPVPPVLQSGDHASVRAWRDEQALARTRERRPDLLDRQDRATNPR